MAVANVPILRDTKDLEQKKILQQELKDLRAQVDALGSGLPLDEAGFQLGGLCIAPAHDCPMNHIVLLMHHLTMVRSWPLAPLNCRHGVQKSRAS